MLVKRDVEATSLKRTVERMKRELQHLQQQQQQSHQQQQRGVGEADSNGQHKQPSPPQQQQQQRSGPPPAQQAPHSWAQRAQQQQQQHQQQQQQQQREGTAQSFQHGAPPFFNQFQHHPFFQQFFSASGFPFGSAPYGGQHQYQQQPQQPCQPPPASSSKPAGAFPDLAAEPPVFAQSTSAGALKVFLLQAGVSEVQITGATMHQAAWAAGMLETCATGFHQGGSAKVLYSFNYVSGDDTGAIAI